MFKLNPMTWYYVYTDEKKIILDTEPPERDDKELCWRHPKHKYKTLGMPIRFETTEGLFSLKVETSLNIEKGPTSKLLQ